MPSPAHIALPEISSRDRTTPNKVASPAAHVARAAYPKLYYDLLLTLLNGLPLTLPQLRLYLWQLPGSQYV